ncbi:uncharacterized protein TRAVEDRAFT_55293 [Trametes versicolor FP-101664 SS1]|uniref:uncharacterized protein n=1 Tax=Trametes versicolor (strain FP-101664) TaxID=717944 RepID=UPI000462269C|nr:uncharacterized protein TRAVEDRAFT_55293 [Trametes versicolor FP-101664 SS1]EIW64343.1 hypothetical protein TRAVEDRAFT_55293 [Trametes versicolor FP-101664 SS1]
MPHHASLTATLPSLTLASLFQVAAGRAWARTRPTRAYHRTSVRSQGIAPSNLRTVQRGHDGAGGVGGPSSSTSSTSYAVSSLSHDKKLCAAPSLPPFSTSPFVSQAADVACGAEVDPVQASARPAFFRARKRNLVTPINVERLSTQAFESPHPGSAGQSTYESDPPWEEVRDSVPEFLLPRVSPPPLSIPKQLTAVPDPTTPEDLLANLTLAVTSKALPPLGPLLSYHAAYGNLHSTASFNLLIKLALRHASFGTARSLLGHMLREDVAGDVETRALRVRCMVRIGSWEQAWREEMERMKEDGLEMPYPVWLEFFGSVKWGAISLLPGEQRRAEGKRRESVPAPAPAVAAGRLDALMEHPPLVTQGDFERMPPHAVFVLVRTLAEQGRRPLALSMTTQYFQSLPEDIDEAWQRSCLSIIHLHLKPGPKPGLTEHYAARKTLYGFLRMHRAFRPTSTTLYFLLRTLRQTTQCGRRAEELVQSFTERWGPDIVDDAVRRRLAAFWLKQGDPRRANAVVEVQNAVNEQREGLRVEKEAVLGDSSTKDRARRLRWLNMHRSPTRNREGWRWRVVRRRLWRAQERRARG